MQQIIFLLGIFLFITSCDKQESKACPEGQVVFNEQYCVSGNKDMINYQGLLDFYCMYDSLLVQFDQTDEFLSRVNNQGGSSSSGIDISNDRLFLYSHCGPNDNFINSTIETTTIVVDKSILDSKPDEIIAKVYHMKGPHPAAEILDSTIVQLNLR